MAVQVLVDHGVPEDKIVFVTYFAGKMGLNRLTKVFPAVKVVVCTIVADFEERVSLFLSSRWTFVYWLFLPSRTPYILCTLASSFCHWMLLTNYV